MTDPFRPPSSWLGRLYLVGGTLLLAGYVFFLYTGRELGSAPSRYVPEGVRSSPGGYRSFHFWYIGYHGGK